MFGVQITLSLASVDKIAEALWEVRREHSPRATARWETVSDKSKVEYREKAFDALVAAEKANQAP
jgi:hypothetical protein